jgi:type I restriction enzyme, S subunit
LSEWRKVRLGDYVEKIGSGATPRGGQEVYQESGIALIRSQNIYNNYFSLDGLAYINDDQAKKLRYLFRG